MMTKFFIVALAAIINLESHKAQFSSYYPADIFFRSPLEFRSREDTFYRNIHPNAEALFGQLFSGNLPKHPPPMQPLQCKAPPPGCEKSRYRTFDGTCNNLFRPTWGAANTRYGQLLSHIYSDGVQAIPVSVTGQDLPNARLVSLIVFGEKDDPDPHFTLLNMQWGQVITHDMSMLAGGTQLARNSIRCCTEEGQIVASGMTSNKRCFPIIIPKNDPAFSQVNKKCINFVRTLTDKDVPCSDGHQSQQAQQITVVTAFMDLSLVYGNSDEQNAPLRENYGGRLRVAQRNGHEWPPQVANATAVCDTDSPNEVCYQTGDARTNQNPELAVLQVVLLREHNRIADALKALNPHWDDELTFQEARKINWAQFQHISYYEWLPIFLGRENMLKNRLIYETTPGSYVNDYDPSIDPSVLNSHATGAFRYFHTQIEGRLDIISEIRAITGSLRLSDWFNKPVIIEIDNNFDGLTRGLATQPQEKTDINFDVEIKHFLFRRGRPFGSDLRALDIQRNRDHGLATYNDYREFCGLPRAHSWEDYKDLLSEKTIANLRSLYPSHEDVDFTVGASLEDHVEGALAGPTFLCVLTEQFFRTRVGDRFFFENGNKETGFTRNQLIEIRKSSAARLLCDNANYVQSIQRKAFIKPWNENPIVPCAEIPQVDLSAWKDVAVPH